MYTDEKFIWKRVSRERFETKYFYNEEATRNKK